MSRLILSTQPGGSNQPAGGGGAGSFITSGINRVYLVDPAGPLQGGGTALVPVALTSSAYHAVLGDTITYHHRVKLFDVNRSFATGTINPNIKLLARSEEGLV